MQIVIFTYDREEKLDNLLEELPGCDDVNILIVDDGSKYNCKYFDSKVIKYFRFPHTGKKGFYKKWDFAIDYCLASKHNDFLFLPDDIENINMGMIQKIIKQGWSDVPYVVNVINDGRTFCWGRFRTGQMPIEIDDTVLNEVGFTDCGFLSNRHTMEQIQIDRVSETWFDRPDKSSGVGHQLTKKMRKLGVKMLMPTPSLCTHGDHESKMHKEHRKKNPLISK